MGGAAKQIKLPEMGRSEVAGTAHEQQTDLARGLVRSSAIAPELTKSHSDFSDKHSCWLHDEGL